MNRGGLRGSPLRAPLPNRLGLRPRPNNGETSSPCPPCMTVAPLAPETQGTHGSQEDSRRSGYRRADRYLDRQRATSMNLHPTLSPARSGAVYARGVASSTLLRSLRPAPERHRCLNRPPVPSAAVSAMVPVAAVVPSEPWRRWGRMGSLSPAGAFLPLANNLKLRKIASGISMSCANTRGQTTNFGSRYLRWGS
jgi:hypothetical protein